MAFRQIWSTYCQSLSTLGFSPSFPRFFSNSTPYIVKVGVPEFMNGVGKGVESHTAKLESEIGDFQKLLVTRTFKLKKLDIPCKHTRIKIKVEDAIVFIKAKTCMLGYELNIETLKSQAACLYYLQLPAEKRSNGLLPVIGQLKADGRTLTTTKAVESLKSITKRKDLIEASIGGCWGLQLRRIGLE